ncbi:MAG: hypothetical protein AAGJ46_09775 [Planctomycetota bacterium]
MHQLWCWGYRLEKWIDSWPEDEDPAATESDWMVTRPHEAAANAMMALSIDFPTVVEEIRRNHRDVESRWEEVLNNRDATTEYAYRDAIDVLSRRILRACEILRDRLEPVDPKPAGIPPEHRSKSMTKAEAAKLHNRGVKSAHPTSYLENHGVVCEGSRGAYYFDVRQFPESVRQDMKG